VTIPIGIPYLRADAARISAWDGKVTRGRRLRVGLVWSSGVRPNEPHLADLNLRNVPLRNFAEMFKNPQIDFYSLQLGQPAESELEQATIEHAPGLSIINLTARLSDFAETAALVEHLDLVISVDTATAHLAGALGKPVWILVCANACWRWLQDRSDSPWYPTARLYRQRNAGDWVEVIHRVSADLNLLAHSVVTQDIPP
jgi:hypothetical protein